MIPTEVSSNMSVMRSVTGWMYAPRLIIGAAAQDFMESCFKLTRSKCTPVTERVFPKDFSFQTQIGINEQLGKERSTFL